jgi:hypothetical protein
MLKNNADNETELNTKGRVALASKQPAAKAARCPVRPPGAGATGRRSCGRGPIWSGTKFNFFKCFAQKGKNSRFFSQIAAVYN